MRAAKVPKRNPLTSELDLRAIRIFVAVTDGAVVHLRQGHAQDGIVIIGRVRGREDCQQGAGQQQAYANG